MNQRNVVSCGELEKTEREKPVASLVDDLPLFAVPQRRQAPVVVEGEPDGLREALARVCQEASQAIAEGKRILVLSDRHTSPECAPIPSLLLTSAVHHHLIRQKERTRVGLVVESGDRPDRSVDDERRRYYRLTEFGREVAIAEIRRLESLVSQARQKQLVPTLGHRR